MNIFNTITDDFYDVVYDTTSNPITLVILIAIIIVFYILFAFLGRTTMGTGIDSAEQFVSPSFKIIEALLWVIFILLVFVNGLSYFFNINVIADMKKLFSPEPEIAITSTVDISLATPNEVYHIPGNRFSYHDAKAICNAYDSELATYSQLDEAQKNGASWCSYGWTKDQLALYPTSQNTWNELQEKEGHEYDCGIPGINGGKVNNPHTELGVNCYGLKPKKSELELAQEKDITNTIYPKTIKEKLFDDRVEYWKKRSGNVIIAPFNSNNWNKIN